MFHHFHGGPHPQTQGSISADQLEAMIEWLHKNYNLIGAKEFSFKANNNEVDYRDLCLTFDDALLCQLDIALPVITKYNLDVFFFIYTSPMAGVPDPLEIYRYFRTVFYDDIDTFYRDFFEISQSLHSLSIEEGRKQFEEIDYLSAHSYYSENDRWFRYIRDIILTKKQYDDLMTSLMDLMSFDHLSIHEKLWMTNSDIKNIAEMGHTIGLHSFYHPTKISFLSKSEQHNEYAMNKKYLESLMGREVTTMSHPCGDYSSDTLDILRDLGIILGFRSNSISLSNRSALEFPRANHIEILKLIEQ